MKRALLILTVQLITSTAFAADLSAQWEICKAHASSDFTRKLPNSFFNNWEACYKVRDWYITTTEGAALNTEQKSLDDAAMTKHLAREAKEKADRDALKEMMK